MRVLDWMSYLRKGVQADHASLIIEPASMDKVYASEQEEDHLTLGS